MHWLNCAWNITTALVIYSDFYFIFFLIFLVFKSSVCFSSVGNEFLPNSTQPWLPEICFAFSSASCEAKRITALHQGSQELPVKGTSSLRTVRTAFLDSSTWNNFISEPSPLWASVYFFFFFPADASSSLSNVCLFNTFSGDFSLLYTAWALLIGFISTNNLKEKIYNWADTYSFI